MSIQRETQLQVDGMSCGSCVRHVGDALRGVPGVSEVDVQLKEGRVVIRHDEAAELSLLVEAVRGAGYEARAA